MNQRISGSANIIIKAFVKRLNEDVSIIANLEKQDFTKLKEMSVYVVQTFLEVKLKHYFLTQTDKDYIEGVINTALKHRNIEDYLEYIIIYSLILYYAIKDNRDITSVDKDFGSEIIHKIIDRSLSKYLKIPYPNLAKQSVNKK